jgi:phosphopantothenoylcysteine synthetase/decarboxylase
MGCRTDDNKEGTFEVSLFAELFNEMLMRDSAFLLYKTLANIPEKAKEKKKDDKKEKEEEDHKKENGDKEDEEKDKKRDDEDEKEKEMITKDSDLLLGCSYFDLSHCGYFETKVGGG